MVMVGKGRQQRRCAEAVSRAVPLIASGRSTAVMMAVAAHGADGDNYF
jgi:hypothetical protein